MKARYAVLSVMIAMTLTCSACAMKAKAQAGLIEAFKETPFYSGGEITADDSDPFAAAHPKLTALNDGGEYLYLLDSDGFINYIVSKDMENQTYQGREPEKADKEKMASDAADWFDKVFYQEEEILGKEKNIVSHGFDGGSYLYTIKLMLNEYPTGNSGSLSFSVDGRLMIASFIRSKLSVKDIAKEAAISDQDVAVELAKKALEKDSEVYYKGKNVVHCFDRIKNVSAEKNVVNGKRVWEVKFEVPTSGIVDWDTIDLACFIRIDMDTGETVEVATSGK